MPYLTSWDVNTFLCLVYWGIPDDVVKRMMIRTKKTHEEFSLSKAFSYWVSNSPSIVRVSESSSLFMVWMFVMDGKVSIGRIYGRTDAI